MDLKENDKLLYMFTERFGKIVVVAKGSKKSRNKFFSVSNVFCYGEYILYKGKNLYSLNEGYIIDSFLKLMEDLETLTYGSYFGELIDISQVSDERNPLLFKDYLKCLYTLKSNFNNKKLLSIAFILKIFKYSGSEINFNNCALCGKNISNSNHIRIDYNGFLCNNCNSINSIKSSFIVYNALKYLNVSEIEKCFRISLKDDVICEMENIILALFYENYGKKANSLQILKY